MNIQNKAVCEISPYLTMQFMEPLGTADSSVDAGWDYLREEWRPELIDIVRELSPKMVRWGGCFASYYHWKEAVGPERTPMLNLCWDGLYSNRVGTKEICDFCEKVGAEPLLVVNMESDGRMHWAYPKTGMDRFGTAEEAAAWVRYCNDPDDALRISHGDKAPFSVCYWQIGNETSYDKNGYDLIKAQDATRRFAKAMRQADPSIKLIAWGDDGWAKGMLDQDVDMIAFHHHFGSGLEDSPLFGTQYRKNPEKTWQHMLHAHYSLREHIASMREQVRRSGKRLAMTEGHFALPGRNRCEVLSSWMAGVAYALCLNDIWRAADILDIATMADFFGNRWQVNAVLLPTPMRPGARPYLQPVGQVMKLFGKYSGKRLLQCEPENGIDTVATEDDEYIYIHAVNTSMDNSAKLAIRVDGREVRKYTVYEIAPEDPTIEITELIPDVFNPETREIAGSEYNMPKTAVSVIRIDKEDIML